MLEGHTRLRRQTFAAEREQCKLLEVERASATIEQAAQHIAKHVELLRLQNLRSQSFGNVFGVNAVRDLVEQNPREDASAEGQMLTRE